MEIRDWAERLVFSDRIADKLTPPNDLTDSQPGLPQATPLFPGRPASLRPSDGRAPFPTPAQAHDEKRLGEVLHFFANHELLALELMALMLLKFPNAPSSMRQALVFTIAQEQSHMTMYTDRMAELGVELGQIPVNSFFWDCLAHPDNPAQFFAGMSLVFEQANLDHSLFWHKRMVEMGDAKTAALLHTVYTEEIGHVQSGLKWFEALRTPDVPLWEGWVDHLAFPMTPARARGPDFDEAGRRAAGFDEHFTRRLRLFRHSRGRPPSIWVFEPDLEAQVASGSAKSQSPKIVNALRSDLQTLPGFLASADDVVIVDELPRPEFLESLLLAGFTVPEFATDPTLPGRTKGPLRPWGWSPHTSATLGVPWQLAHKELWSKAWAAQWRPEVQLAHTVDDVMKALPSALAQTGGALIKCPFSTSGRHRRAVTSAPDPQLHNWIANALAQQGCVLVEPRYKRLVDISMQFTVTADQKVRHDGAVRFFTNDHGQYLGAICGRLDAGLPTSLRRFLHGDGSKPHSVERSLEQMASGVGRAMAERGFVGPAGIDAMIVEGPSGPFLVPLLEINPRITMGRIALALRKRLHPKCTGIWRILRRKEVDIPALQRAMPLQLKHGQLHGGALVTTDAAVARQFCSVMIIDTSVPALHPPW